MHHFGKLGVLHHHSLDDAQERFVARKETRPSSESVSLEHALACVLRKDLDNAPAFGTARDVPLEVTPSVFEHGVEFVRH